jgi:hypothetical protein
MFDFGIRQAIDCYGWAVYLRGFGRVRFDSHGRDFTFSAASVRKLRAMLTVQS